MAKTFHVEIVTPQGMVLQDDVESVTLPGAVSPFQVLVNHAPILSELETGDIRVVDARGHEGHYATSGGFAEMKANVLTVIAETVEPAEKIDVARARSARSRAVERIHEARTAPRTTDIDIARAEAALARAINRLNVAGRG